MKVELIFSYDEDECSEALAIKIDGEKAVSFYDGEPEDRTLGRCFNDCYSIGELMKKAYEAGKNGEKFEYESKKLEWKDYQEQI